MDCRSKTCDDDTMNEESRTERESWKYCHRCNLAERVSCPGRSQYYNSIPLSEEIIAHIRTKGMSEGMIDCIKKKMLVICYKEQSKEEIIYFIAKKEPTKDETQLVERFGLGKIITEDQMATVEEKAKKIKMQLKRTLEATEKSERFAA